VGDRSIGRTATTAPVSPHAPWAGVRTRARASARQAGSTTATARAAGRLIGLLAVFALLVLVVPRVLPSRRVRRKPRGDRPERLIALAAEGLPPGRQDWGRAMAAELHQVRGNRARWRFSLGCAQASALIQARAMFSSRDHGGKSLRAFVLAGIAAAAALALYGLIRYPGLGADPHAWATMAGFLALVLIYAVLILALSSGATPRARGHGLAGGLLTGGAWFAVLSPVDALKEWVLLPLFVALLAPACAAYMAARRGRDVTAAAHTALSSGVIGGLVLAIAWVTAAYVRDGRPYDAGLVRDFHSSGASDLATYAVRGDLYTGLELLVFIPLLALAFGSLAATRASFRPDGPLTASSR
jgi:hypothetical protein